MKVKDRHFRILLLLSALASFPAAGASVRPALGKSCMSPDPDYLCLGLKYVVYSDQSEHPIVAPEAVAGNIRGVNSIWSQCKIGFEVDEFVQADPVHLGLPKQTENFSDLDRIRQTFSSPSSLLLVTTYRWKREGNLGHTSANAWTKMPGSGLYGIVLEQKVATFPNIIAHELGHYLNLYHHKAESEVMNAVIYSTSKTITPAQCQVARAAVKRWWGNMLRKGPTFDRAPRPQLASGAANAPKGSAGS